MKKAVKIILFFSLLSCVKMNAQVSALEISQEEEKQFSPYMMWRHNGSIGLADFKKDHPLEYQKELWYYTRSFYIKRDHLNTGAALDKSMIPIDRFETSRLPSTEAIVVLPGFKDALVLLPENTLIYKPKAN